MRCPRCGKLNADGERICWDCKAVLERAEETRNESSETYTSDDSEYSNGINASAMPVNSSKMPVSSYAGLLLVFAFLLLVVAWAWQESVQSQRENLATPHDLSQLADYYSHLKDLNDSARTAGMLWNLGVIIAVLGAIAVAFAKVRK